jgi:cellulose synthase/poly-beta-1,6-N-acetylglucosamine synthase-like glycosyltransferase
MDPLDLLGWIVAVVFSVPLLVLAVECFAALKPWRMTPPPDSRPRCAILVPAHNEELVIARTLAAVAAQIGPEDRVLVVADNCTDTTANVVREFGSGVVERTDPVRRGKGYALAFGRDALSADPPNVVIVLDADCTLGPDALRRLAAETVTSGRPIQGCYLMTAPPEAGPNRQVAAFAFLVKNLVRPLGLRRLGQPCLLMGTGMGFPWEVFRTAPLAHGHIVEDLGLTVDLALAGHAPLFVPDAEIRGEFPIDERAASSQRRRWEHGHLRVIRAGIPRLLALGVLRFRPRLLIQALDVGVPPLSALVLACSLALCGLGLWATLGGPWGPVATLGGSAVMAAAGLVIAWLRFGRSTLPTKTLFRVPWYALKKVGLYFEFLIRPQRDWVRTARDQPPRQT